MASRLSSHSSVTGSDPRNKKMTNALIGIGVGALFHPLQHAKVLIQLGHEPLPLKRDKAWYFFGKQRDYLPNGFRIAQHIYQEHGLTGLYCGVTACVCGNIVGFYASMGAKEYLDRNFPPQITKSPARDGAEAFSNMLQKTFREAVAKCAGIIVARPFQVIMIRKIAQEIGGETSWAGFIIPFFHHNKQEGIRGYFAGLFPQLIGEMFILWTSAALMHFIERAYSTMIETSSGEEEEEEEEDIEREIKPAEALKKMLHFVVPYCVNSLFYEFQLVATVMAVNGCGLACGMEPYMPVFASWTDCQRYLKAVGQDRRGAKLFFRFYDGPVNYADGERYASTKMRLF